MLGVGRAHTDCVLCDRGVRFGAFGVLDGGVVVDAGGGVVVGVGGRFVDAFGVLDGGGEDLVRVVIGEAGECLGLVRRPSPAR